MIANEHDTQGVWNDPDDAPELRDEWFEQADVHKNGRLVSRGRPRLANPKQRVTIRLDDDVVTALRAAGPGWQTRANAILRDWMRREGEGASKP